MYKVYIDGELAYYPGDEMSVLTECELHMKLGDSGTFEFDITEPNRLYNNLNPRVTMVQVLKDEEEIFYGEVRDVTRDLYNVKHVYCVGEMAFLLDSIQPQAAYHDLTTRQMLETWLNWHNSRTEEKKHFQAGIVTIHDSNDSLYRFTNEETTLDAIREKLCERLGGYLKVRKVNGVRYLDWLTLEDYGKVCEQPIKFGLNLLDYSEDTTADSLYTAVIPHGERLEESPIDGLETYLDITSVNDGKDYVFIPEAVEQYGWVTAVKHWEDVTIPENLKIKGEEWLRNNQYETMTLEINAVDLSVLSQKFDSFELGDRVHALAKPYGMDRFFPVQELDIYLQEPERNILVLGSNIKKSYTEQGNNTNKDFNTKLEETKVTTEWLQSAIDNATQMLTGKKGGYKVSEYDEDGRWIRDLYMDAPRVEDAVHVMQVSMAGIGFSRTGFEGPYLNAWTIDGVFLGEFIKANSVSAEKLTAEYKSSVTNAIDTKVTAKFEVADGLISAEVKRAQGQEVELAAAIKVAQDLIQLKVSQGQVESLIAQNADSIRLKANKIAWASQYSSMTEDGKLNCTSGTFNGKISSVGNKSTTTIDEGQMETRYSDTVYTLYKAYGDSDGSGCAFMTYGAANGAWQRFYANKVQVMIAGWAKQGLFESRPTVYLPQGICVPNKAYVNQLYFQNDLQTKASMSGNDTVVVCHTSFSAQGWLTATGTKSRIIDTENYGERLQYCYETPTPMFGDIGTAATDENGLCYVSIDDVFAETINTEVEYCVFLQKEGSGDIWVETKDASFFVVKGTANLPFSWEVKAVQRDYEQLRLDDPQLVLHDTENLDNTDIEEMFSEELYSYDREMEELYNG